MLIKAITGGLYPNKFHILREYVQNSYDAIREWKEIHPKDDCFAKVNIKNDSISIYDNATGMTKDKVIQYRYLGFSKKRFGDFAGYRGIGSAAGISIADQLIVTTSPHDVAEKYTLSIRAGDMLKRIDEERHANKASTIKELMKAYSEIEVERESKDRHYSNVELIGIRQDAKDLLDANRLMIYFAANVPVPFHPDFRSSDGSENYGQQIDAHLTQNVRDYYPMKLFAGNQQVYKMYRARWTSDKRQNVAVSEPGFMNIFDKTGKMIAYAWYCSNMKKGQLDTPFFYEGNAVDLGGLVLRLKGFAIGDKKYVRDNIWQNSDHVAYYFMGEVHICDDAIEPTSERSALVDHPARSVLFDECWKSLGKYLVRKAYTLSSKLRAAEVVHESLEELKSLESDAEKGIVNDLVVAKQVRVHGIIKSVKEKTKKKDIPSGTKAKAEEIVERSKKLLEILAAEGPSKQSNEHGNKTRHKLEGKIVIDVANELHLNKQAADVYKITIKSLKDFFAAEPEEYERLVQSLVDKLREELK
jgi:molecular chaperone HtpG